MDQETLLQRRNRTRAIVEGALLGDIAIVFLLIRAYLPVLFVRPILAALAAVPIVMLTQRRGFRTTVLAAVASYALLSALVGPFLGIAALNVALAGCLIGLGRRVGFGITLNTLVMGPIYGVVDLLLPTVASVIVFRYPVHDLIKSAKNAIGLLFRALRYVLGERPSVPSVSQQLHFLLSHPQFVLPLLILLILFSAPADRSSPSAGNRSQGLVGRWREMGLTLGVLVGLYVLFNVIASVHVPVSWIDHLRQWQRTAENDWQAVIAGSLVVSGTLNIYLVALVSHLVLRQVPAETLLRQKAA